MTLARNFLAGREKFHFAVENRPLGAKSFYFPVASPRVGGLVGSGMAAELCRPAAEWQRNLAVRIGMSIAIDSITPNAYVGAGGGCARAQPAVGCRRMTGVLPRYTPLLLLAVAWEAVSRLGVVSPAALPPLDNVAAAWFDLAASGDLWTNGVASITRGAAGLGLAIVCGSAIGVLMAWYLPVRVVINPIVQFFYPMPKTALIPVMVLWLGFGDASKVVVIFIGCMLPVTLSAFNGARGAEQVLIWSARSLGASRARVLWEVVLPSALPELLSGIRTALAFAFVLLVASELIVARRGLGYMIGFLGDGGVYDAMFAVVMTVAALGFAADRGYLMLMRRVLAWRA